MKTKQMAYDAILTAMCAVLGLVSLDFGNLKITFEDLPILLGAALFGPWDGMIIGVLGQMLRFGADPTLPLWVIPLMMGGIVAGLLARRSNYSLEGKNPWITMIGAELVITTLNTVSLIIYSNIYGFYTPAYILAPLLPRFLIAIAKGSVYANVMPPVIRAIRKTLNISMKKTA